ncbi:hypothetical protein Y032_0194g1418 [Ancylostoma ceylanicum]|uniref:Uncharacterized protein n=1 Tax=Ancylostoma ceylanicum TaxID=53326 RepID=A0A016SPV0_9BILA|nr:hypothetical protein Y032_0194g1418 [Ancylostoma ceylanicum]
MHPHTHTLSRCKCTHTVLLKKIDGFRVCTIAAGPERGMRREHAPNERVEPVPPRFCSRDAKGPHAQSVYLFEKDCTCTVRINCGDPSAASKNTRRDRAAHGGIVTAVTNLDFLESCSSHLMVTNKKTG